MTNSRINHGLWKFLRNFTDFTDDFTDNAAKLVHFTFRGPTGYHMKMSDLAAPNICPDLMINIVKLSEASKEFVQERQVINDPTEAQEMTTVVSLVRQESHNCTMHVPEFSVLCLEGSLLINQTPHGSVLSVCPIQEGRISKKKSKMFSSNLVQNSKSDIKNAWSPSESQVPPVLEPFNETTSREETERAPGRIQQPVGFTQIKLLMGIAIVLYRSRGNGEVLTADGQFELSRKLTVGPVFASSLASTTVSV